MRLLALGLVAALAACSPEIDLTADAALEAASAAAEAGDTRRAMVLIDHAAESGNLHALMYRNEVFSRGHIRVPKGYVVGETQRNVALPVTFWHRWEAQSDLEAALESGVEAGDSEAMIMAAQRLSTPGYGRAKRDADPDSARAIYSALEGTDVDPMQLWSVAFNLGDRDAGMRHLETASRAGHPTACHLLYYWGEDTNRRTDTAEGAAYAIDYSEGCRSRAFESGYALEGELMSESLLNSLMTQVRVGNALSITLRDSLLEGGLLERHPRLLPFLETTTDA